MPRNHETSMEANTPNRKGPLVQSVDNAADFSGHTKQVRLLITKRWIHGDDITAIQRDFAGMSRLQIEAQARLGVLQMITGKLLVAA